MLLWLMWLIGINICIFLERKMLIHFDFTPSRMRFRMSDWLIVVLFWWLVIPLQLWTYPLRKIFQENRDISFDDADEFYREYPVNFGTRM